MSDGNYWGGGVGAFSTAEHHDGQSVDMECCAMWSLRESLRAECRDPPALVVGAGVNGPLT